MSLMSREQRYNFLCSVNRAMQAGTAPPHYPKSLTEEEQAFIVEYATEKFDELMKDPEVIRVMERLKYR